MFCRAAGHRGHSGQARGGRGLSGCLQAKEEQGSSVRPSRELGGQKKAPSSPHDGVSDDCSNWNIRLKITRRFDGPLIQHASHTAARSGGGRRTCEQIVRFSLVRRDRDETHTPVGVQSGEISAAGVRGRGGIFSGGGIPAGSGGVGGDSPAEWGHVWGPGTTMCWTTRPQLAGPDGEGPPAPCASGRGVFTSASPRPQQ